MHIVLNRKNIGQVTHTTLLLVTIDDILTWREQIKMVEIKLWKNRAVSNKTMHVLDCQALHTLYKSLVESHICHIAVRYGEVRINLGKLFLLQKTAIRINYALHYHDHTSAFFS